MGDNLSASAWKEECEARISKMRAEAMKEVADIQADFEKESKARREAFKTIEAINQSDHRSRAEFEAILARDEKAIKRMSDGIIDGLDAMEQQMRADNKCFEQRVRDRGKPSVNHVVIEKSYTLGDFVKKHAEDVG